MLWPIHAFRYKLWRLLTERAKPALIYSDPVNKF